MYNFLPSGRRRGAVWPVPDHSERTCHLRNTRLKTRQQPCDSAVFSLGVQVAWLRLRMRRRGASPGRPVRVLESRTVVVGNKRTGWFRGELIGDLPGSFASDERNPPTINNLEVTMKMVKSLLLGS